MLYQYTATDQNAANVRGSIDAPSLDEARSILIGRGMEISELKEARQVHPGHQQESTQPTLKTMFAFEGVDGSGVIRRGTLQAESKYEAFEHLRESQNLTLSMLSPVGVTPQYHDRDLEMWQKKSKKLPQAASVTVPPAPLSQTPARKLGFSPVGAPTHPSQLIASPTVVPPTPGKSSYTTILSTLRLYAGWLLAWYAVFVSFGYYVHNRALPFSVPFVEAFYLSSLMLNITIATFLFLLLSTLHRFLHGSRVSAVLCTLAGIALFLIIQSTLPT